MPSHFQTPAKWVMHCSPCEHHKRIASFHVRSGPGSWVEYVCQHPAAAGRALFGAWKYIGQTEKQPEWCPLRRKPANAESSHAGTGRNK